MQWNSKEIIILYVPWLATHCGRWIYRIHQEHIPRILAPQQQEHSVLLMYSLTSNLKHKIMQSIIWLSALGMIITWKMWMFVRLNCWSEVTSHTYTPYATFACAHTRFTSQTHLFSQMITLRSLGLTHIQLTSVLPLFTCSHLMYWASGNERVVCLSEGFERVRWDSRKRRLAIWKIITWDCLKQHFCIFLFLFSTCFLVEAGPAQVFRELEAREPISFIISSDYLFGLISLHNDFSFHTSYERNSKILNRNTIFLLQIFHWHSYAWDLLCKDMHGLKVTITVYYCYFYKPCLPKCV